MISDYTLLYHRGKLDMPDVLLTGCGGNGMASINIGSGDPPANDECKQCPLKAVRTGEAALRGVAILRSLGQVRDSLFIYCLLCTY